MRAWRRNPESGLEAELRSNRPEPSRELVDRLEMRVRTHGRDRRAGSFRVAFAGALAAGVLTALASVGGLGYAATVIVVDDDVDPFNLPQVMWALSTKMNPAGDLIQVPNMPVLALAPQADTPGIVDKLIIDATTPIAPDHRGNYDNQVHDLPEMSEWLTKLQQLAASR